MDKDKTYPSQTPFISLKRSERNILRNKCKRLRNSNIHKQPLGYPVHSHSFIFAIRLVGLFLILFLSLADITLDTMNKPQITIKDIARALNVSPSTVSRALKNNLTSVRKPEIRFMPTRKSTTTSLMCWL